MSLAGQFNVALASGLGLLVKCVQHVDRIGQARRVDDPVSAGVVPHAQLFDALTN